MIKIEEVTRGDDTRAFPRLRLHPFLTDSRHYPYSFPTLDPAFLSTGAYLNPSAPLLPPTTPPQPHAHLPPESPYFLAANRNKRSVTINFKSPQGRDILLDLIRKADVLVENYVPGKLESMGLGYEDVRKVNPGLVYASISGKWTKESESTRSRCGN